MKRSPPVPGLIPTTEGSPRHALKVLPGGMGCHSGQAERVPASTVGPSEVVRLFEAYAPLIYRILRRVLGNHDIEDIAQDVFVALLRGLERLRKPEALRAFIVSTTVRVARWQLRKRGLRRQFFLNLEDAGEVVGPDADPGARRAIVELYRILDALSATDRTIFVLRFIEGMELEAIALSLRLSLSTTKRRVKHSWNRVAARSKRSPYLVEYVESLEAGRDFEFP